MAREWACSASSSPSRSAEHAANRRNIIRGVPSHADSQDSQWFTGAPAAQARRCSEPWVCHMNSVRTKYASTVGQRTLPIGVAPVPGEALESWLATIAQRLDIAWGDLLGEVMPPATNSPRRRFNLTTHLHSAESSAIAAATGVEQATVEALTLARYDGTLLTIDRESHRVRSPWTPQRSRYCPLCLKRSGGRWQLSWRLPWVFVCDKHACLLVDACPSCGQFQRVSPWWLSARMVPELARCAMMRDVDGLRVRCDGVLSAADTTPLAREHPIATAQARLFDILSTASTTFGVYHLMPTSSLQVLTDLRVLAAGSSPSRTPTTSTKCSAPAEAVRSANNSGSFALVPAPGLLQKALRRPHRR